MADDATSTTATPAPLASMDVSSGSALTIAERLRDHPRVQKTIMAAARAAAQKQLGASTAHGHSGAHGNSGSSDASGPSDESAMYADAHAMSHAWLFTGPPGAGRSTTALNFAAALLCETPGALGCGHCQACRTALAGKHTDVVHVVPQELSIGVDFVRDKVVASAAKRPTVGAWRVVIFEDADRLTDGAANALLKTIEEPPAHTVIILCAPSTDPEDFPQTLRSRCRHLYIPALPVDTIVQMLVDEGASENHARLAAHTSLRHVGRARKLVKTPAIQQRRAQAINLAEAIFHEAGGFQAVGQLVKAVEKEAKESYAEADEAEVARLKNALGMGAKGKGTQKSVSGGAGDVRELEKLQKKRQTRRLRDVLDLALVDLAGIYRDALMVKLDAGVELTHPDFQPLASELAEHLSEEGLVECQDAISHYRELLGFNVSPQIAFDGLVGRLRCAYRVH